MRAIGLLAAAIALIAAVGAVGGPCSVVSEEFDTDPSWQAAWDTGDPAILQSWFAQHTGPTALNGLILTGQRPVYTQKDAEALAGYTINGSVRVLGDNIRLHNFALRGDGSTILIEIVGGRRNITIEDVSVDGGDQMTSQGIGGASYASGVTVQRVQITGVGSDAVRVMDGGVYRHLYIHDLWRWDNAQQGRAYNGKNPQTTDPHTDGAQAVRGGGLIEQSWIDNHGWGSDNATSAIFIAPNAAKIDGWTIRQNYLDGGGYAIHVHNLTKVLGSPGPSGDPQNIVIADNRFGRNSRLGLFSTGDVVRSNLAITGNVWADDLTPVPAP